MFIHDINTQAEEESSNSHESGESSVSDTQLSSQMASKENIKKSQPLIKGVEEVALTHYIHKTNEFTHGKHAETATLRTLFGLVFWDIIFDSSVPNVFVDRFQPAPLDLQTEHFYPNRKFAIDSKLGLIENAPIEFICELIRQTWEFYKYFA